MITGDCVTAYYEKILNKTIPFSAPTGIAENTEVVKSVFSVILYVPL
jgi:hypothetical protein